MQNQTIETDKAQRRRTKKALRDCNNGPAKPCFRPARKTGRGVHLCLVIFGAYPQPEDSIANLTDHNDRLLLIRNGAVAIKQLLMQCAQKSITQMGYVPDVRVTFFGL
jgi:hypothetical protein